MSITQVGLPYMAKDELKLNFKDMSYSVNIWDWTFH